MQVCAACFEMEVSRLFYNYNDIHLIFGQRPLFVAE